MRWSSISTSVIGRPGTKNSGKGTHS
jgi:hypothetical protein